MKWFNNVKCKKPVKAIICLLVLILIVSLVNPDLFIQANDYTDPAAAPFSFELLTSAPEVGKTLELVYTPLSDGLTDVKISFPSNLTFLWGTWNEADIENILDAPLENTLPDEELTDTSPSEEMEPDEELTDESPSEEMEPAEELTDVLPSEEMEATEELTDALPSEEMEPAENTDGIEPLPGEINSAEELSNTTVTDDQTSNEPSTDESPVDELTDGEIIIEDPLIALASYKDLLASSAGVLTNDNSMIMVSNWANLPGSCIVLSFRVDSVAETTFSIESNFNGDSVTADVDLQISPSSLMDSLPDGTPVNNYDCTTHTLTWSNAPGLSGNTLSLSPLQNVEQSVKMQINYSFGGILSALPGEIKIRVPRYAFYDRNGLPIDSLNLSALPSLTQAQTETLSDSVSFCYYFEGNDIVITNFRTFNAGTFTCEYAYLYMPYLIRDGYTKSDIQATFTYKHVSGNEEGDLDIEITDASEMLAVNVTTKASFKSVTKNFYAKYEAWQSTWGTAPANAADYFYVAWSINCNYSNECTQPYKLILTEDPGSYGEVVLKYTSISGPFTFITNTQASAILFDDVNKPTTSGGYSSSLGVVVKYPKALVNSATPVTQFSNTATIRLEGVDGAHMEKTANADYTYQKANFTYAGDSLKPTKTSNNASVTGALNALQNTASPAYKRGSISFYFGTDAIGWDLTNDGTDYNKRSYTVEVIDDLLYLAGERLQPEDYGIKTIGIAPSGMYLETVAIIDPISGLSTQTSTAYASYKPVTVYYKTRDNDSWQVLGTFKKTGSSDATFTPVGGVAQRFNSNYPFAVPEGTIAVKYSHTGNDYRYYINASVDFYLNPTEHVLKLIKDLDSVQLYNIQTLRVIDSEGAVVNGNQPNSSIPALTFPAAIKTDIIARDAELYGSLASHAYAKTDLTRLQSKTQLTLEADVPRNNAAASRIEVDYTAKVYEMLTQSFYTAQETLDYGYLSEQTNSVFYTLLPIGTTVDLSTINVTKFVNFASTVIDCPYAVRFVENWQGSRQTMMIVEATFPEGLRNIYASGMTNPEDFIGQVSSGFTMRYTLLYPWNAYQDYGTPILNSLAYRSLTGPLGSGVTAGSTSLTKKQYFSSLADDSGYADDTNKNTVYVQLSTVIDQNTAAELGISKLVKGAGDMAYANSAQVPGMGTYTYCLRFANQAAMTSQNLILYDVLEKANPTVADRWHGTLVSVDISQPQSKGIAPVVYYSVVDIPDADLPLYKDISDTGIWSATPPADLSSVTAVAIDLRKKSDGGDYVFQPKETVYCYLTMRTPDDYENYLDPKVFAYNRPYYSALALAADSYTSCEGGAVVTVSLRQPDISLGKSSNPPGGTLDAPNPVNPGGSVVYTLTVANTNKAETLTGVEIIDNIPEGLSIDYTHIQSAFGTTAFAPLPNARIGVTRDGQKLMFSINKLTAGEQLRINIPCVVEAQSGNLANTAVITQVGGKSILVESPTVCHTINNTDFIFKKSVNGKAPGEKVFTFTLKEGDNVIATAVNDSSGTIRFPIPVKSPGEYTYTVSEVVGTESSISYDPAVFTIHVDISDFYGVMVPQVTYMDESDTVLSEAVFENEYNLTPLTAVLHAKKILKGKTLNAGMFSFIAQDNDSGTKYAATNQSDGSVTFALTYDSPGQYSYTVYEVPGGPGEGVTYDNNAYTVIMNVTDHGDGTMTATPDYSGGEIVFTNLYNASNAEVTLNASVELIGADLTDGMFGFIVEDNVGREVAADVNEANGTVTLSPIRFSEPGTYTFTVSQLDGGLPNIIYDKTVYTIMIIVTDDEHGKLSATVVLPDEGLLFINEYKEDSTGEPDNPLVPDNPVIPPATDEPVPEEASPEPVPDNPIIPPVTDEPAPEEASPEPVPDNPVIPPATDEPVPEEASPEPPPLSPSNDHTYIYDPVKDEYDVYTRDGKPQGQIKYPHLSHIFIYRADRDQYSVVDTQGELIGYVVLTGDQTPDDVVLDEDLIPLASTQFETDPPSTDQLNPVEQDMADSGFAKENPKTSDSIIHTSIYAYIMFVSVGLIFLLIVWYRKKRTVM